MHPQGRSLKLNGAEKSSHARAFAIDLMLIFVVQTEQSETFENSVEKSFFSLFRSSGF